MRTSPEHLKWLQGAAVLSVWELACRACQSAWKHDDAGNVVEMLPLPAGLHEAMIRHPGHFPPEVVESLHKKYPDYFASDGQGFDGVPRKAISPSMKGGATDNENGELAYEALAIMEQASPALAPLAPLARAVVAAFGIPDRQTAALYALRDHPIWQTLSVPVRCWFRTVFTDLAKTKTSGHMVWKNMVRSTLGAVTREGAWLEAPPAATDDDPGVSLADVTDEPDSPVTVLEGLAWHESLSILGSRAKSGKTTLIVDRVVRAFEAGRLHGGVLCFSEMSKGKLKRYLRTRGARPEWIAAVRCYPILPAAQIAEIIAKRQPDLFVVDSLTPLVTKTFGQRARGSLWDAATVSGVLTPLRETERPGLVTHHSRKEDDRLRDSTGIEAEVDMIVTTALDDPQSDRPRICGLRFNGRWDQPDERLTFDAATCTYRHDDSPAPSDDQPVTGSREIAGQIVPMAAEWLTKHLQPGESLTLAEIQGRARTQRARITRALKLLIDSGAWTETGEGRRGDPKRYSIPFRAPNTGVPETGNGNAPESIPTNGNRYGTESGIDSGIDSRPIGGTETGTESGIDSGTGDRERNPAAVTVKNQAGAPPAGEPENLRTPPPAVPAGETDDGDGDQPAAPPGELDRLRAEHDRLEQERDRLIDHAEREAIMAESREDAGDELTAAGLTAADAADVKGHLRDTRGTRLLPVLRRARCAVVYAERAAPVPELSNGVRRDGR